MFHQKLCFQSLKRFTPKSVGLSCATIFEHHHGSNDQSYPEVLTLALTITIARNLPKAPNTDPQFLQIAKCLTKNGLIYE